MPLGFILGHELIRCWEATMNRREAERCPVCQGPAVADLAAAGGMRCRLSTCVHNHQKVICPRCKQQDLGSVTISGGKLRYTCKDCLHEWSLARETGHVENR